MVGKVSDGINDGGVAVLGEGADDGHARVGGCIGGVDDAKRCLAGGDKGEGRAHIVGLRDLWCDRLP